MAKRKWEAGLGKRETVARAHVNWRMPSVGMALRWFGESALGSNIPHQEVTGFSLACGCNAMGESMEVTPRVEVVDMHSAPSR